MINTVITQIDHENVKVIRSIPYEKTNGSEGFKDVEIGTYLMSIQGIRSSVKVEGLVLNKSLDGSKIDSTFIGYSANIDIKAGDILQRIERDNLKYEVIATEPKGVGTILEQRETIINRIGNQDNA